MVEVKLATSPVRDRPNWVWWGEDGSTNYLRCATENVPNVHEGYSLHLTLVHQSPADSVLTTEVVDPPLGKVRDGKLLKEVLPDSPFIFSLAKT